MFSQLCSNFVPLTLLSSLAVVTSTTTPTAPREIIPGQLCDDVESPCCDCKPGPPICDGVLCYDYLTGSHSCSQPGCQPGPDVCRYVDCVMGQPGCDPQCYRQTDCTQPGRHRAPGGCPTSTTPTASTSAKGRLNI